MAKPKSPDAKQVALSCRVTEQDAEQIDRLRGGQTRARWLESLIEQALGSGRVTVTEDNTGRVAVGYSKSDQLGRRKP